MNFSFYISASSRPTLRARERYNESFQALYASLFRLPLRFSKKYLRNDLSL